MYFPLYVDMADKDVLIIGGGAIGYEKAKKLHTAGARITLISPEAVSGFAALDVFWLKECYEDQPLGDYDLVIAATGHKALNETIGRKAKEAGCLCNQVTARGEVIFPSQIQKGAIAVAVTSRGEIPFIAKKIRDLIAETLPDWDEDDLAFWAKIRSYLIKNRPQKKEALLEKLWAADWRSQKNQEDCDEILAWLQKQSVGIDPK